MTHDIKYVANTPPKPLSATMAEGPKSEHAVFQEAVRPDVWTFERLFSAPPAERRSFFRGASVIIATGEDIGYRLAFEALRHGSKARVLIIFHGHSAYSPRNRLIIAALKRFSQIHWLTLSNALRLQLVRDMAVPEGQCHNLGHAADIGYFAPSSQRRADPLIASAGTASRDFATLIEAVRPLETPLKIAADSAWLAEPVNLGSGPLPPHGAPRLTPLASLHSFRAASATSMDLQRSARQAWLALWHSTLSSSPTTRCATIASATRAMTEATSCGA